MSIQRSHRVAVLSGDGIGPEVTSAALEVVALETALREQTVEVDESMFEAVVEAAAAAAVVAATLLTFSASRRVTSTFASMLAAAFCGIALLYVLVLNVLSA